jgi:hypothetical protein
MANVCEDVAQAEEWFTQSRQGVKDFFLRLVGIA